MLLLLLFAFFAGLVTVLSPCVLPVLPAILSVSAGQGRLRPLGVILGLVCSFIFFTLALTSLVQALGLSANVLRYIAIGIIGLFGIVALVPALGDRFAAWTGGIATLGANLQSKARSAHSGGFWSGWLVGAALGLVWTPCAGPILAAITTLVATQQVTFQVFLLTLAYSLGAGLPLLLIAYGGNWALKNSPFLVRHAEGIRQLFGGIMIFTAIALLFNWDVLFQQKVLDYLPSLQIENQPFIQEKLQQLRSSANPNQGSLLGRETSSSSKEPLPKIAPAPNFVGIEHWINSKPLTVSDLKGRVFLVDFWTYSCINCIRTFPYLRDWYEKYKGQGFVIVGVHTPEFEFEKDLKNVEDAVKRFDIQYPVAMDNHYATWQAYNNHYWPAHYLVDKEGIVREIHYGEGMYLETENGIRALLNLPPLKESGSEKEMLVAAGMTRETYLGYARAESYPYEMRIQRDKSFNYDYNQTLKADQVGLKGEWTVGSEKITSDSDESVLELNFMANQVYLVLGGQSTQPIRVELDSQQLPEKYKTRDMAGPGEITVKEPRKYDLVNLQGSNGRHVLTLRVPKGIEAYAFTFGMEK